MKARLTRAWPAYVETLPSLIAYHPVFTGGKRMHCAGTPCELKLLFPADDRFPARYLATFPDGSQSYLQSTEVEECNGEAK